MSGKVKLLIADDHEIFRRGLRQVIEADGRFDVVAEAEDGGKALRLTLELKPDVLISDISMPVLNGFQLAEELSARPGIHSKVIFLTMHSDDDIRRRAQSIGVHCYVLKDSASEEIIGAVEAAIDGRSFAGNELPVIQETTATAVEGPDSLTKTEQLILMLVGQYKTSKEIAHQLFISHRTVENHRTNICSKLNIKGSHALARYASSLIQEPQKLTPRNQIDRRRK